MKNNKKVHTLQEFIFYSNKIHNNKYSYEKFKYINTHEKGIIICPIHGEFTQMPSNHLRKNGCPSCVKNKIKTQDEVIEKFNLIHNNKYSYEKFKYISTHKKGIIICHIHGPFYQAPSAHLRGRGCKKCGIIKCSDSRFMKLEDFIKKARKIHNDKYSYEKFQYENSKNKSTIICRIHGDFEQSSASHLRGAGCNKCGGSNLSTKNEFIIKANKIHNNKYLYDLFTYTNNKTKSKIMCNKHGVFEQTPSHHLNQMNGCPKCKKSKGELLIQNFLQKQDIRFYEQYKFNDCKNIEHLRFDFYLPDYKICIEFDGEQHFKPIKKWGGVPKLLETQNNDKIKNMYCLENNIKLIRISYLQIKDIIIILNNNLLK